MSTRTSPWPAGVPCWADLTAPDVAAARAFYAAVLGWSFEDTSEEYGGYVIAHVAGRAAAGIGPQMQAGPPAWTLYIASDDADATADAVTANGGTVLLPPGDVGPLGRVFIATDPTGPVFGVWQAGTHIGAGVVNEPGGLTWEDLRSPDPETAWAFYSAVFGYRTDPLPGAGPDYATFSLPGESWPLGGMGPALEAEGGRAHWLVYFGVADADEAAAAAAAGGGAVQVGPFGTPFGRMAGLADPAGAPFWIAATGDSPQPDRSG